MFVDAPWFLIVSLYLSKDTVRQMRQRHWLLLVGCDMTKTLYGPLLKSDFQSLPDVLCRIAAGTPYVPLDRDEQALGRSLITHSLASYTWQTLTP